MLNWKDLPSLCGEFTVMYPPGIKELSLLFIQKNQTDKQKISPKIERNPFFHGGNAATLYLGAEPAEFPP